MVDCSKCKQYWHQSCVTLDGLNDEEINKLVKWLCPFCYTAPISTNDTESSCMSCRNTRTLRDANNHFEVAIAASHLKSIDNLNELIEESSHLSTQTSIKCIEAEMSQLSEKCDSAFSELSKNVDNLQTELSNLKLQPASAQSTSPAIDSHETFLKSISEQLELLTSNQHNINSSTTPGSDSPSISETLQSYDKSINELTHNITKLQQDIQLLTDPATTSKTHAPSTPHAPPPPPIDPSHNVPIGPIPHCQQPFTENTDEFISVEEADKLITFIQTCSFKQESGHSVCSFGEPYKYTGAKSSEEVPPIPEVLKPIMDKINGIQSELYRANYPKQTQCPPVINSCLVNRYEGPESFLPKHSDKEVTIHPESSIFTLSIGQDCSLTFIERDSGVETELSCSNRSLYHMSRKSQEIFNHQIKKGSVSSGVRFSFTFRSVNWKNRNSTCVIGDSNTGLLCFGSCKRRTFGELMPGQKFFSPRVEDIDPKSCMGYANVVLLCGINDIRRPDVKCESDIKNYYQKLKLKVRQIQKLSPSTTIFICRLLPTKDHNLNRKVDIFNRLIYFDLVPTCEGVQYVEGFEKFAQDHVLAWELSKPFDRHGRPDMLHLNRSGARVLAGLLKHSIFLRLNGGIDRRRHTGRVNGRLYSNVASGSPVLQQTRANG